MELAPLDDTTRPDVLRLHSRLEISGSVGLSEHKFLEVADRTGMPGIVASAAGRPAGYVHVAHHRGGAWEMEVIVDPGAAPGTRHVLASAGRSLVPAGVALLVWAADPETVAAWTANDWEMTRRLWRMESPLPVDLAPPTTPGVTIRAFRPGRDDAAWVEVNNAAFAGHPENGDVRPADLERRSRLEWFDPAGFLCAWRGERMLGFCWTKVHGDGASPAGEIYVIGVRPEAQGMGLGTALVARGLEYLSAVRAMERAFLYVEGANSGALRFYERLGFRRVRAFETYATTGTG